jgi:hypothetical protein
MANGLSNEVKLALDGFAPVRKQLEASNSPESARLIESTEKFVLDEFSTAMTCRMEVSCNTSGVCEVKLVCTF